jgi:hypothetical protein
MAAGVVCCCCGSVVVATARTVKLWLLRGVVPKEQVEVIRIQNDIRKNLFNKIMLRDNGHSEYTVL